MRGPGKGKTNNPHGRTKGSPNKSTKEAKELLVLVMNGQIDFIGEALAKIRDDNPVKYLDALSKLLQFTMPKQVDIKSDGEKITDIKVTYVDPGNRKQ